MRALLVVLALTACASDRPATPPSTAASGFLATTDALVRPFIDGEWFPGISVALVHDGVTDIFTYGKADASGRAPTPDTVFELGSISKVFTSLVLASLVERGEVSLDDPVQKFLPPGTTVAAKDGKPITLVSLATHTSGLPRTPSNLAPVNPDDAWADYDAGRLYAYLSSAPLSTVPGEKYDYSNTGMGLLGHALTLKTGRDYDALVVDTIAKPLGMSRTRAIVVADGQVHAALGHDAEGKEVPPWTFSVMAGAGAVRSSVADMARLVGAHLHPPEGELGRAIRRALSLQPSTPEPHRGLGWGVGLPSEKDGTTRWHNGQTAGFHSFVAVDLERELGVVVLANQQGMELDVLGSALLMMLRKQPYKIDLPPTVPVAAESLAAYVGNYQVVPGVVLGVTQRGGDRLYGQLTGQQAFRVFHDGATDHFYFRVVPAELQFERDDAGKVVAVTLIQGGERARAPRL